MAVSGSLSWETAPSVCFYRALSITSTQESKTRKKKKNPAGAQMHNSWRGLKLRVWPASWMKRAAHLHLFIEGGHLCDCRKWWCQRSRSLWPEREVSATADRVSRIPSSFENGLCQRAASLRHPASLFPREKLETLQVLWRPFHSV